MTPTRIGSLRAAVVALTAVALTLSVSGTASAEPDFDCGPGIEGQYVPTPDHRVWRCVYGSDGPLGEPGRYWHWTEVKRT